MVKSKQMPLETLHAIGSRLNPNARSGPVDPQLHFQRAKC